MTRIRQLTAAKERLGSQIDRLDCSDRHYEQKYTDMQNRINSLYDEIAEATENLETVQTQIKAIKEQKISQKRIFEFLELFDIIYNEFTEFEKKEFLHSFIKKIEIYSEPLENGQILKSIQFRFPVYYQGNEADMFIPNFENTVETVVLLSRETINDHTIGNLNLSNNQQTVMETDAKRRIAGKFTDNRPMTDGLKTDALSKFRIYKEKLKCSFLGDSITAVLLQKEDCGNFCFRWLPKCLLFQKGRHTLGVCLPFLHSF